MHRAFSYPVTVERSRTKERLEACLAGLCELELRRQRQECLVLGALALGDPLAQESSRGELRCFSSWGQENLTLRRQLVRSLCWAFYCNCMFAFQPSRITPPCDKRTPPYTPVMYHNSTYFWISNSLQRRLIETRLTAGWSSSLGSAFCAAVKSSCKEKKSYSTWLIGSLFERV